MDVFIPEEYVIRRRMEKAAARGSRTSRNHHNNNGGDKMDNNNGRQHEYSTKLEGKKVATSDDGGLMESVVFSYLSA
ncbi:hypothetical protein LIER_00544 [Lithospermum erythrorhizon]|uniref:Uncharacterized protein n=1 Tax=Lithospermum erythrorhizon TaxID=34254 RepID=A0AAV3NII3_LITER